jgi:ATP-dependent helicase IRC3
MACSSARADHRLCPAKATSVHADLDLSNVATSSTGDFKTAELSSKMDKPEINQLLIKTYRHLAAARRSTLIFCVDLAHVEGVVSTFRNAGIDARSVSSMSKPGYRRETLAAFMKGEFPVLVNCEVLTEGTDIPVVSMPQFLAG